MLPITHADHIGIRIKDPVVSRAFYEKLGFELVEDLGFGEGQSVVMRHPCGLYVDMSGPADEDNSDNILMDREEQLTGITHIAFHVESIPDTLVALEKADIALGGGPIEYPRSDGRTAMLIYDPDRNVIELVHRAHQRLPAGQTA